MSDDGRVEGMPEKDPEGMATEAYPLLQQAVGSILRGSEEARSAYDALLARGLPEEAAREEIARVLLATMFHVGAQSELLEKAGGGAGLRKEAFARLAMGETARQNFEGPSAEDWDGSQAEGRDTGVSGSLPASTARAFAAARSHIACRASRVALPRCGSTTQLGRFRNASGISGSFSNTSSPAAARCPEPSTPANASWSTIAPRAVFTRTEPGFMDASLAASSSPRVSAVSGR